MEDRDRVSSCTDQYCIIPHYNKTILCQTKLYFTVLYNTLLLHCTMVWNRACSILCCTSPISIQFSGYSGTSQPFCNSFVAASLKERGRKGKLRPSGEIREIFFLCFFLAMLLAGTGVIRMARKLKFFT